MRVLNQRVNSARLVLRRGGSLGLGVLGNGIFAACQWLIVVVIAQRSSPQAVGQYSLAVVITTPVVVATNLQLRNLVATGSEDDCSFRQYVSVRAATVPVDFALIALILIVGRWGASSAAVVMALLLAKEVEAASDLMYGYMLRGAAVADMATSLILRGVFGLAGFVVALTATSSLPYSILALALAWCAVGALLDVRRGYSHARRLGSHDRARRPTVEILRNGLPLGLSSLIVVVGVSVPRLFIEGDLGTAELGIYTALAFTVTAGTIVVNSICQILLPNLASRLREVDTGPFWMLFRKLIVGAIALGMVLIVLATMFGEAFLRLVYGDVYAAYGSLLIWLMVGGALTFASSVVGWALIATRRSAAQLRSAVAGTASTIAASAVLVPISGLKGAAWGTAIGMAIQSLAGLILLRRSVKAPPADGTGTGSFTDDASRTMPADR